MFETMNAINAMNTNTQRTDNVIEIAEGNRRTARRNTEDLFYRVNRFNDPYSQQETSGLYDDERLAG
ncbi:hypothetical protein C1Y63_10075 [Corynebacterium sp. 13CS0277]|uniref:hypothetical protein n=1 Tax=Corynebacterium sp. 13CS0277 TaxID=2071994 RepID=UPI000D037966|nr:hypothetical protein [Corynebacterium sp. 13CS0277]PRQ10714.1 hypothetical protein C1Y63_10075 [Corynebacterium sp. 13CS0277]